MKSGVPKGVSLWLPQAVDELKSISVIFILSSAVILRRCKS